MIPPFLDPDAPTPGECSQRLLFFREMVAYWGRARLVAYALGDADRQAAAYQQQLAALRLIRQWSRFLRDAQAAELVAA